MVLGLSPKQPQDLLEPLSETPNRPWASGRSKGHPKAPTGPPGYLKIKKNQQNSIISFRLTPVFPLKIARWRNLRAAPLYIHIYIYIYIYIIHIIHKRGMLMMLMMMMMMLLMMLLIFSPS